MTLADRITNVRANLAETDARLAQARALVDELTTHRIELQGAMKTLLELQRDEAPPVTAEALGLNAAA